MYKPDNHTNSTHGNASFNTNGRYTPDTAKLVAKNILKTGIPPKEGLNSWEEKKYGFRSN